MDKMHETIVKLRDRLKTDSEDETEGETLINHLFSALALEYVARPKDTDGVPIRPGDEMRCTVRPQNMRHHNPTVTEVLEQALTKAAHLDRKDGYWPSVADIAGLVNEYAPKILLAFDPREAMADGK